MFGRRRGAWERGCFRILSLMLSCPPSIYLALVRVQFSCACLASDELGISERT